MIAPAHILIVEDERHLAEGLKFNLEAEGYRASLAPDADSALALLERANFPLPDSPPTAFPTPIDAIILDIMLPGRDGFSVVEALRRREDYTPVLILTARGRPEDVLRGFSAGADDYLPKPFDLSILLARLHGLLRRRTWLQSAPPPAQSANSHANPPDPAFAGRPGAGPAPSSQFSSAGQPGANPAPPSQFSFAGRVIDFDALELRTPSRTIRLTLMEADLLRHLVLRQGRIVSRKELLEQVWRVREDTDTRAIDNFIVRLRRYLEDDPAHPTFLQTVRGVGYRFLP
jgi:DNA-binding response OmpR family regulator